MRITNQMMARASAKSGIPLQQTSMLNYLQNMNKTGSQTLLSSLGNTTQTNSLLRSISKKNSLQLESSAESLSDFAAKLAGNGDDSLFAKAEQSGDTSEIIATAERMAESYNKTIKSLKSSDSTLNKFYLQELSGYTAGQSDALKAVGITRNKDGSLSIQKDTLKSADLDSLKKAFGSESGFAEKVSYVGSRVAQNAAALGSAALNGYSNTGRELYNSFARSMYDFWG